MVVAQFRATLLVNKLDTPKLKMFCMEKSWTKVQTDNGSAKVEPVKQSEEGVGKGLHQIGGQLQQFRLPPFFKSVI